MSYVPYVFKIFRYFFHYSCFHFAVLLLVFMVNWSWAGRPLLRTVLLFYRGGWPSSDIDDSGSSNRGSACYYYDVQENGDEQKLRNLLSLRWSGFQPKQRCSRVSERKISRNANSSSPTSARLRFVSEKGRKKTENDWRKVIGPHPAKNSFGLLHTEASPRLLWSDLASSPRPLPPQ